MQKNAEDAVVERVFGIGRTAEILDCSRSMVDKLMRTGQLAYTRIGSDRKVPASAINAYIEKNLVDGAA